MSGQKMLLVSYPAQSGAAAVRTAVTALMFRAVAVVVRHGSIRGHCLQARWLCGSKEVFDGPIRVRMARRSDTHKGWS